MAAHAATDGDPVAQALALDGARAAAEAAVGCLGGSACQRAPERGDGRDVRDAARGEAADALERLDGLEGAGTELTVGLDLEARLPQQALKLGDVRAAVVLPQRAAPEARGDGLRGRDSRADHGHRDKRRGKQERYEGTAMQL